jgi:hypothetical protein
VTPAKKSGVEVKGKNKWIALMQNAFKEESE